MEFLSNMDWMGVITKFSVIFGMFLFYSILIYTTVLSIISAVSSISHDVNDKILHSRLITSSMLWAIFILMYWR